jgi:hypothetical protein
MDFIQFLRWQNIFQTWYRNFSNPKQLGNFLAKPRNNNSATCSKEFKYLIIQNKLLLEIMIMQYVHFDM